MNSSKILLQTFPHHPKNYGQMNAPHSESSFCWEQIQKVIPKNGRYIKHFVESEWIENKNYPIYEFRDKTEYGNKCDDVDIPCGDLNYWLIVYWEEGQ